VIAVEGAVRDEDLALRSSYHDLVLPPDVTTEVHVKADRTTVAWRRIPRDLVDAATT
jgi:hypothetical protein